MARHRNNNSGFTLIEMLTVVSITAILTAIALPSFYKDKSFVNTVPQIESTFRIVGLKARANSGNPYRLTLQTTGTTQSLKVQYITGNNCNPTGTPAGVLAWESNSGWKHDPIQTFNLPPTVVITASSFPTNGFCFNGRGEVIVPPGTKNDRSFDVTNQDPKKSGKAVKATFSISAIGDINYDTFDKSNNSLAKKFN
jgi:prepilin-type N-terminal cleavage/methylation domain-containing protein